MVIGMRTGVWWRRGLLVIAPLGISLALVAAPVATADSVDSAESAPQAVAEVTSTPAAAPTVVPGPVAVSAAPADGLPHLPSPDNLPPGTTQTAPEGPNLSYLRYLWQAVRTPGVTMGDALILIAQRPLDANASPQSATPAPADHPPEPASP